MKSWWVCPAADCGHEEQVSLADPDSSFDEILGHIRQQHPSIDTSPSALWPIIEVVEHA